MKKTPIVSLLSLLLLTGCTNTIALFSQHASKFTRLIQTKVARLIDPDDHESRLIVSPAEFYGNLNDEFVPLNIDEFDSMNLNPPIPQPFHTPGSEGSVVPGIDSFSIPGGHLAELFKRIHFNTDQYTPSSQNDKILLQKMAAYLKKHPNTYVFIEGHCDERGSEAYNLALGTKRSGTVRNILISYGANPNQLYSISYGKEKPLTLGKSKEIYAKNRRASFKLYSKGTSK
jgi:peptidoglycan-associated lipoprotein